MPPQTRRSPGTQSRPPAPHRAGANPGAGRRQASRSGGGGRGAAGQTSGRPALLAGMPGWLPAAAAGFGPVAGVVAGKVAGNYYGPGFAVICVAAALLAACSAASKWLWYLIPAMPPVIWLAGAVAELEWRKPAYKGTKEQAVGLVHATTHTFPVIATCVVVMGLVAVVGAVRERNQKGARRGR